MGNQSLNSILLALLFVVLGLIAWILVAREHRRLKKFRFVISKEPSTKSIELLLPDKSTVEAKLLIWDSAPENPEAKRIKLLFSKREFSSTGVSYFHALCKVRCDLETEGILLKCYGCSRNVWPSPMGDVVGKAYKLFLGKTGELKDVVSIFDSGADVAPCTFQEQKEFHKQWLLSIGIDPDKKVYPWKNLFLQRPIKTLKLYWKVKTSNRNANA